MTKVSVITIIKDDPAGLQDTGNSLAMQTGCNPADIEWVIVDGSANQAEQVKQVADSFGSLVSGFYTGSNKGIYPAMNVGLENATGDWQLYMNAGDKLAKPDTLATMMMHTDGADFIYGDINYRNYRQHGVQMPNYNFKRMIAGHQTMAFRRDVIGDQRYDERYKIAGDFKFSLEYLQKVKNPVYIPEVLADYEGGGVSEMRYFCCAYETFFARKQATKISFTQNLACMAMSATAGLARQILPKSAFNFMRDIYRAEDKITPPLNSPIVP